MFKIEIPKFEITIIVFFKLLKFLNKILTDIPSEISVDVLVVISIGPILRHIRAEMNIVLEFTSISY